MHKKGGKNKVYSPEFKITVIEDMRGNELGYKETERKYGLAKMRAQSWERIYLEEGVEGLMKERRGRATKLDNSNVGRPPKL